MDIIVLQQLPKRGKTTTIGLVYNLIIQNGGIATNRQPLGGDPNDFSDIVTNYKSKKIAFFSMGDNSTALSNAIYEYYRQKCDLVICALSTGTPKKRANNAINKFNPTRIDKATTTYVNLEQTANNKDSQTIFNLI